MRKLFFIALVLMVIGTVSFGSRDKRPICIIAKEWAVAKVEAGQLPTTIEELNKYRVAYRRAAFETMSPDQRSSMWRQHITKFRASREFNAAQLALIDESLEFLKTAFHQKNDVQYEALKSQIPGLFPSKADQKQFALLGVPDNAPAVVGLLRNVASVEAGRSSLIASAGLGLTISLMTALLMRSTALAGAHAKARGPDVESFGFNPATGRVSTAPSSRGGPKRMPGEEAPSSEANDDQHGKNQQNIQRADAIVQHVLTVDKQLIHRGLIHRDEYKPRW